MRGRPGRGPRPTISCLLCCGLQSTSLDTRLLPKRCACAIPCDPHNIPTKWHRHCPAYGQSGIEWLVAGHTPSDRLLVDRKCSNPSVTPLSAYGEVGGASGQGWLPRPPRHSGAAIATSSMSVPTQPWPGFQGSASARPTRTATFHLVLFCAGGHLAPRGPSTVTSDGTTRPHRHICGRDFLGRSYRGSDSPLARSAGAPGNGLVSPSHRRASGSHTHRRR